MKNWKKILILTALTFCALGCTMTIEGDWPGGWSNLDNTQHQNNYKTDSPR